MRRANNLGLVAHVQNGYRQRAKRPTMRQPTLFQHSNTHTGTLSVTQVTCQTCYVPGKTKATATIMA